jgi:hypothetical protein
MWQNNASDWNGPKTRQAHARRLGFADPAQEVLEGAAWEMVKNAWGRYIQELSYPLHFFFILTPSPSPFIIQKALPHKAYIQKQIITRDATSHPVIETPAWRDR